MPAWVFFIDNTVQNRVGAKAFGTYASIYNLGIIFAIILDFGITNYNTRFISQNPDSLETVFPKMLSARMVLMFLYGILVMGIGLVAGYSGYEMLLLGGIVLIQCLLTMTQFLRSNVSALQWFKTDSILSVTGRLCMIVICGFLLVYKPLAAHFKIEWFIGTQVVCYFIAAVVAFIVLTRIHPVKFRFSFSVKDILNIARDSFPYALTIFLMSVYTRSDMWLIKQLLPLNGKEQAGIYAAAYRWLDVCNTFGLMFASILLSLFGRMLAEKQDVQPIVKLSVNIMLPVSLLVAGTAFFFGNNIMHLLYKDADYQYALVFAALMASYPFFCITYVYSTLLSSNGNMKAMITVATIGSVINLLSNFYFIPHQMAYGAAMVSLVTQGVVAICYTFYASKILSLPFNGKWVLAHAGYLLLLIVAGYAVVHYVAASWLVQFGVFAVACLLLMFLFRFVSIGALKQLMRR